MVGRDWKKAKSRHPLPLPSTTVQEAEEALARAAQTSTSAKERVEKTQIQFLEALAAAQHVKEGAVAVVKQGWGWGNWVWWIGVEVLLVWGVFRCGVLIKVGFKSDRQGDP